MVILNAETRSFERAAIVMQSVVDLKVSTNTIERVSLEVGNELAVAEQDGWTDVLVGEVPVPMPPACFLNRNHVAKLTEQAEIKEKQGSDDRISEDHRDVLPHLSQLTSPSESFAQ